MNKKVIFGILILLLIAGAGVFQYKKMKSQESSMPPLSYSTQDISVKQDITVKNVYAFATASGAKTGAAFMTIENPNQESERLITAQSDIAEITEIHESLIDPDDGKMMMRKVKALSISREGMLALKPKGYHIMFIELKQPLKIGESFPLTLVFENTGQKIVDVKVVAPGKIPGNQ